MSETIERKYALIKVKAGDYVMPSNDGLTLWRIMSYVDGPSQGLDWPRDITVWGCWKWALPLGEWDHIEDPLDFDHWGHWSGSHDSRADAISSALTDLGS